MFADSPGLHGVEHPIYDVWLVDCKGGQTVIHEAPPVDTAATDQDAAPAADPNAQESPVVGPPPPPKKKKPKPAVLAAPLPGPNDNAPLDLGGAVNSGSHGR
jgi:hypothetical protein